MVFSLTLKTLTLYIPITKRLLVTLLNVTIIWPSLKGFCFSKAKLTTTEVKLKHCTLWTVHAQETTKRNYCFNCWWSCFAFVEIYRSLFTFYWYPVIILSNDITSTHSHLFSILAIEFQIYISDFIISNFNVFHIILALIFNSSIGASPPVFDCFRFCASLISEILEFQGTSYFAGIVISFPGISINRLLLWLLIGAFSTKI